MGPQKWRTFLGWGHRNRLTIGTERCYIAFFEEGRKRLKAKVCEWLLESGKGKIMERKQLCKQLGFNSVRTLSNF